MYLHSPYATYLHVANKNVRVYSKGARALSGPVKPKVTVPRILFQCLTRSSVTQTVPSHSAILGMTG